MYVYSLPLVSDAFFDIPDLFSGNLHFAHRKAEKDFRRRWVLRSKENNVGFKATTLTPQAYMSI
jgi:hypothetical protein